MNTLKAVMYGYALCMSDQLLREFVGEDNLRNMKKSDLENLRKDITKIVINGMIDEEKEEMEKPV